MDNAELVSRSLKVVLELFKSDNYVSYSDRERRIQLVRDWMENDFISIKNDVAFLKESNTLTGLFHYFSIIEKNTLKIMKYDSVRDDTNDKYSEGLKVYFTELLKYIKQEYGIEKAALLHDLGAYIKFIAITARELSKQQNTTLQKQTMLAVEKNHEDFVKLDHKSSNLKNHEDFMNIKSLQNNERSFQKKRLEDQMINNHNRLLPDNNFNSLIVEPEGTLKPLTTKNINLSNSSAKMASTSTTAPMPSSSFFSYNDSSNRVFDDSNLCLDEDRLHSRGKDTDVVNYEEQQLHHQSSYNEKGSDQMIIQNNVVKKQLDSSQLDSSFIGDKEKLTAQQSRLVCNDSSLFRYYTENDFNQYLLSAMVGWPSKLIVWCDTTRCLRWNSTKLKNIPSAIQALGGPCMEVGVLMSSIKAHLISDNITPQNYGTYPIVENLGHAVLGHRVVELVSSENNLLSQHPKLSNIHVDLQLDFFRRNGSANKSIIRKQLIDDGIFLGPLEFDSGPICSHEVVYFENSHANNYGSPTWIRHGSCQKILLNFVHSRVQALLSWIYNTLQQSSNISIHSIHNKALMFRRICKILLSLLVDTEGLNSYECSEVFVQKYFQKQYYNKSTEDELLLPFNELYHKLFLSMSNELFDIMQRPWISKINFKIDQKNDTVEYNDLYPKLNILAKEKLHNLKCNLSYSEIDGLLSQNNNSNYLDIIEYYYHEGGDNRKQIENVVDYKKDNINKDHYFSMFLSDSTKNLVKELLQISRLAVEHDFFFSRLDNTKFLIPHSLSCCTPNPLKFEDWISIFENYKNYVKFSETLSDCGNISLILEKLLHSGLSSWKKYYEPQLFDHIFIKSSSSSTIVDQPLSNNIHFLELLNSIIYKYFYLDENSLKFLFHRFDEVDSGQSTPILLKKAKLEKNTDNNLTFKENKNDTGIVLSILDHWNDFTNKNMNKNIYPYLLDLNEASSIYNYYPDDIMEKEKPISYINLITWNLDIQKNNTLLKSFITENVLYQFKTCSGIILNAQYLFFKISRNLTVLNRMLTVLKFNQADNEKQYLLYTLRLRAGCLKFLRGFIATIHQDILFNNLEKLKELFTYKNYINDTINSFHEIINSMYDNITTLNTHALPLLELAKDITCLENIIIISKKQNKQQMTYDTILKLQKQWDNEGRKFLQLIEERQPQNTKYRFDANLYYKVKANEILKREAIYFQSLQK